MVAAAQVDMVVLTVVPYAHLNVKVIRNNQVVDAQVLLVHPNVRMSVKVIRNNQVDAQVLLVHPNVRMSVRVRPLKDVPIVQHNVVEHVVTHARLDAVNNVIGRVEGRAINNVQDIV